MLIDSVPNYIVGCLPWEANSEMEIRMQIVVGDPRCRWEERQEKPAEIRAVNSS